MLMAMLYCLYLGLLVAAGDSDVIDCFFLLYVLCIRQYIVYVVY